MRAKARCGTPAIVVHANKVQARFAAFTEFNLASDWSLPQEPSSLKVLQQYVCTPDILHGVAHRLQIPFGSPGIGVRFVVHVVVNQTHLGILTACQAKAPFCSGACAGKCRVTLHALLIAA